MEQLLTSGIAIIIFLVLMICGILLTRLLGAWMLRINEVIQILRAILSELQKTKSDL